MAICQAEEDLQTRIAPSADAAWSTAAVAQHAELFAKQFTVGATSYQWHNKEGMRRDMFSRKLGKHGIKGCLECCPAF